MSSRDTVNPDPEHRTDTFNARVIPYPLLICFFPGRVIFQRIQPTSSSFVINAPGPRTLGRVNLHLITVHPSLVVIRLTLASELNARVHLSIESEIKFKDKITIMLFCHQERIWFAK